MISPRFLMPILVTIGLFDPSYHAYAASPDIWYDNEEPTEFSLYVRRVKTILDDSQPDIETATEWAGVSWFYYLQPNIEAGLFGGYSFSSQTGYSRTAGMNLNGAHAGLALRIHMLKRQNLDVHLTGNYTYQNVDDELNSQLENFVWHQFDAGLAADVQLSRGIGLHAAIIYGRITGTETATGPINRTVNFNHDADTGGVIGINFLSGEDGLIGIRAHAGLNEGGEIIFTRLY